MRFVRILTARTLVHCIGGLVLLVASCAQAEVQTRSEEEFIDHGYATWFGTGFYTVADRDVVVVRVPLEWIVRESVPAENKWGYRFLMPLTLGFHSFNFDFDTIDNTQSISFVPGVQFDLPLFEIWQLEPFIQAGIGKDFSADGMTYIYGTGVKSFVDLSLRDIDYRIANRLMFAGQTARDSGDKTGFASFEAGLEVRLPGSAQFGRHQVNAGLFGLFSWYGNRAEFLAPRDEEEVSNIIEIGFSLGTDAEFSLWSIEIPRIGMSFMRGDNGFRGIRFNMGFPF
jgi:hypothetical protein